MRENNQNNLFETNNSCEKKKFITFNFANPNDINFEDYYNYNELDKLYSCKICDKISSTKYKFAIIRHISEQHIFKKSQCSYCHKVILRIDEHIKRCDVYASKKIISPIFSPENFNTKNAKISDLASPNLKSNNRDIFLKSIFNEDKKIKVSNIFYFSNKKIGEGSFSQSFLGGCFNVNEILCIKKIKYDNKEEFLGYMEEKDILISIKNKGNFPNFFDYYFDSNFIYFAESFMGINLKDLVKLCDKNVDLITVINVFIDLINQIEVLHENNILHCDIKTSNICYGNLSMNGKNYSRIMGYVDFGNSKIFKIKNKIIENKVGEKPLCTREYASLEVLKGSTFSRKDDIESIFYVAVKLYMKKLPWYNLDEIINNREKIYGINTKNHKKNKTPFQIKIWKFSEIFLLKIKQNKD